MSRDRKSKKNPVTWSPLVRSETGDLWDLSEVTDARSKNNNFRIFPTTTNHEQPDPSYWQTNDERNMATLEKRAETPFFGKWTYNDANKEVTLCDQFGKCVMIALGVAGTAKLLGLFGGGKTKTKRQNKNKTKRRNKTK